MSNSGLPKDSEPRAPMRLRNALRSIGRSSSATTSQSFLVLVAQEQVLDMAAFQFAAQRLAFRHRMERRMFGRRPVEAEGVEPGVKVLFGGGHRGVQILVGSGAAGEGPA